MIRFISIGNQIIDGQNEFAFYDTVTDTFKVFGGISTWSSLKEFTECYEGSEIERFLNLIPKNWSTKPISIASSFEEIESFCEQNPGIDGALFKLYRIRE